MSKGNGRRELLEQRASEVRSELERRLDVIDERKQHLVEAARTVTRPPASILVLGACGAAAALFIAGRVRSSRRPVPLSRLLAAPSQKSFVARGLERAAVSLIALTVQRLGARALDRFLAAEAAPAWKIPPRVPRPAGDRPAW